MTIHDLAVRIGDPICLGECGLSITRHRNGANYLGVTHFADRRFSHRAARNLLLLVARNRREQDPLYLNDYGLYDWAYLALDALAASRIARECGLRLPAKLWDAQRGECQWLAARRGVKLTKYPRVWRWAHGR